MCFTVKAINLQGYYVISYETTLVIDDGGLWHPPNYDGFATLNAVPSQSGRAGSFIATVISRFHSRL